MSPLAPQLIVAAAVPPGCQCGALGAAGLGGASAAECRGVPDHTGFSLRLERHLMSLESGAWSQPLLEGKTEPPKFGAVHFSLPEEVGHDLHPITVTV